MKAERWRQVDELFDAAVGRDPAERAAFLDQACTGDDVLRREVESLLSAHERAGSFIETPMTHPTVESVINEKARLKAGQRIGHYGIISRLGAGGMGEVYLAKDTKLTRNVAIKLLPTTLITDSQARGRFLREAQLAATLDHTNICTIYEIGEASGQCFIAMQYVEGKTLKDVIAGRPLNVKTLMAISLQVAEALAAAHDEGIIHRDIKPANIIITSQGQVKVLDFGLAKLMDEGGISDSGRQTELSQIGVILGTPAYMSPEQARGESADHRSDIFSLGVLMYEMATGQLPFKGKSQSETLNAIINEPHTSAIKSNKELSKAVSKIIDRAMAKNPANRYSSLREMLEELRRAAQEIKLPGLNVLAGEAARYLAPKHRGVSAPFARWSRAPFNRNLALAGVGAVLLVLAVVVLFRLSRAGSVASPAPVNSLAVMPLLNASGNADLDYLADGITDSVINNLSQVSSLKVMSHSSVFRYKGKEIDPRSAARDLDVQAVVVGQILMRGDDLAISLELVDARDNHQLWGQRYDRKLANILQLQTDVSRDISSRLRLRLSGEEQRLVGRQYTESAEAYQLYLRARYYWNKLTEEGARESIPYFNQALEKDPDYALAYCGLADAYNVLGISFARPSDVFPKAGQAASKALALDDTLAEAHISIGAYKLFYKWDWAGAEREASRAKQLNPSYARAIELNTNYGEGPHFYCWYLDVIGKSDESIREIKRALELAPFSATLHSELAWSYYIARQDDQTIEQCRAALKIDPGIDFTYQGLASAYEQKGMYKEAIIELNKARSLPTHSASIISELGYAYAMSGQKAQAQSILNELERRAAQEYVDPTLMSYVCIGLNDKEQAFRWLDRAYEDHAPGLTWLQVEPKFDPLRADTRFKELLQRVGITQ